ncbi:unnamed protein product [Soboliphyme baturini]|uniref:Uncharacterized protein n=1 Tax=Soboliphyme baturini TaxID=241478 RepID=A0A183ISJ6_9BILA|nr:unnamed protein product [Soboliphyme baturini]
MSTVNLARSKTSSLQLFQDVPGAGIDALLVTTCKLTLTVSLIVCEQFCAFALQCLKEGLNGKLCSLAAGMY